MSADSRSQSPYEEESDNEGSTLDTSLPPEVDLYGVIGVESNATQDEIKVAYKRMALKQHPDKVKDNKEDATKKFQDLAWAYAILSDERRRSIFDRTGSTEAAMRDEEDFNFADFCKEQYQSVVDFKMLDEKKIEYQGSEGEHRDLLAAFEKHEGDLDRLYEDVIFCNVIDDDERFRATIDRAIADGKVQAFAAYTEEPEKKKQRRLKQAQKEAADAAEEQEDMKKRPKKKAPADSGMGDLAALIQRRQVDRMGGFMSDVDNKIDVLEARAKEEQRRKAKRKCEMPLQEEEPKKKGRGRGRGRKKT